MFPLAKPWLLRHVRTCATHKKNSRPRPTTSSQIKLVFNFSTRILLTRVCCHLPFENTSLGETPTGRTAAALVTRPGALRRR